MKAKFSLTSQTIASVEKFQPEVIKGTVGRGTHFPTFQKDILPSEGRD